MVKSVSMSVKVADEVKMWSTTDYMHSYKL